MDLEPPSTSDSDDWRQTHLGRLFGHAMRRFDERVLELMAHDIEVPLALSNLAARGLVTHEADALDARARRIRFTAAGLAWLQAFRDAVTRAEAEFRAEVGAEVATVATIGLEIYAAGRPVRP